MRRGVSKIVELAVAGGAVVLVLLCCGGLGSTAFVEAPVRVLFGWAFFLRRTVPEIEVSPTGASTFLIILAAVAGLTHALGRRGLPRGEGTGWTWRATAGACGLLVCLFAAGVAATGAGHQVGWLVRSPVPLAERAAVVERSQSQNNLKQLGLAAHNYHSAGASGAPVHERFPPGGTFGPTGRGRHGWATYLLPYLGEPELHARVVWDEPWDAPANRPVFVEPLPVLRSPRRTFPAEDAAGHALAHYAANARVLTDGAGLRIEDITDGTTETILFGEVNGRFLPWGHPANARDPAAGFGTAAGFGGPPRRGGAQVCMADGSVQFLPDDIDPAVLRALATPAGGDRAGDVWR